MFGLMEHAASLPEPEVIRAVVPTIALPLTAIAFFANALATLIAGWFGFDLHWEGPKRLFEVLLKPRVLAAAIAMNALLWGAFVGYKYWSNLPVALWRIERVNAQLALEASPEVRGRTYTNSSERKNVGAGRDALARRPVEITQIWQQKLPKGIFGSVVLSGASAFAGNDDGFVREFDRATGKELRKFFVGGEITPDPAIWNGQLVVGEGGHDSHHCRIYFFDLATGLFRGAFTTKGHTEGQPVFAEHAGITSLFVIAGADGVYSVDPVSLKERWHIKSGHVDSEVRVADGVVYFATGIEKGFSDRTHHVIAADFLTGNILWKRELPASGWMPPLLLDSRICFGTGEIYTESKAGWFACYNRKDGTPVRSATMDGPVMSVPYYNDSSILLADMDGQVCSLAADSLARKWCLKTPGKKTYASVTSDSHGRLLYPTTTEGLWVLDPETGAVLTKWNPSEAEGKWGKVFGRVSADGDEWYVADMKGNVRKLQAKSVPAR